MTGLRTRSTTVTFTRPFSLSALDEVQPPGTYRVETDEELLPAASLQAYRRTATLLHLPAGSGGASSGQVVTIDPQELAELLATDASSRGSPAAPRVPE